MFFLTTVTKPASHTAKVAGTVVSTFYHLKFLVNESFIFVGFGADKGIVNFYLEVKFVSNGHALDDEGGFNVTEFSFVVHWVHVFFSLVEGRLYFALKLFELDIDGGAAVGL